MIDRVLFWSQYLISSSFFVFLFLNEPAVTSVTLLFYLALSLSVQHFYLLFTFHCEWACATWQNRKDLTRETETGLKCSLFNIFTSSVIDRMYHLAWICCPPTRTVMCTVGLRTTHSQPSHEFIVYLLYTQKGKTHQINSAIFKVFSAWVTGLLPPYSTSLRLYLHQIRHCTENAREV